MFFKEDQLKLDRNFWWAGGAGGAPLAFTWSHFHSLGLTWSHLDSPSLTWTHSVALGLLSHLVSHDFM